MSAGDFYIRKNSSDETVITQANLDTHWDTVEVSEGDIVSYTNPNLQVDTGIYLIQYSEVFYTPVESTDSTNRLEIQGEIWLDGVLVGGYSQDYIRQDSGQFECALTGSLFLEVPSDNSNIVVRFYRTDDSTEVVQRKAGNGSVSILELDDNHNYGFYSTSATESTSGATERALNLNVTDRQDTGFSRSGNAVTISSAGRYVVRYELDIYQTATARENIQAVLKQNGAVVTGSYGYCYMRGADSTQDGAITWIGIVDVSASDVLRVDWMTVTSATITAKAGAKLQMWQLPSGAETVIVNDTTGNNFNNPDNLLWQSSSYIDTNAFTYVSGNYNIDTDYGTHILAFATMADSADAVARSYPEARFSVSGVTSDLVTGGCYQRNSGEGWSAITINGILPSVPPVSSVGVVTEPTATSGTASNDSGQFALLALESIWNYTYVFPATIATAPSQIDVGDQNLTITGFTFGATQGTGKVEIGDNFDYALATKVEQSIDTWSDTSIQFDANLSGLGEGAIWVFVTNDDGGTSSGYRSNFGAPSYEDVILGLSPDIYHFFQNNYDDATGKGYSANGQNATGAYGFEETSLVRGGQYSWRAETTSARIEMADSTYTNVTTTHTKRLIGGWIQLGQVYLVPSGIYEEGGGVNNLYMVVGFGNILLGNVADSNGSPAFKVQAFSDFTLTPNRPYHAVIKFEGGVGFTMFVDGVEVSKTDGNPITDTTMSTHSGDWSYGMPDGTLDTGGTDIQYPSAPDLLISHFGTWSGLSSYFPTDAEIRTELFEKGAIATDAIAGDTEANMQIALDTLSGTAYVDKPLPLKINKNGSDIMLDLNNITFDDRCSIHVQWMGTSGQTLTLVNKSGSNCDASMCSTPYGGNVVIIETVQIDVNVKDIVDKSNIVGARVLIKDSSQSILFNDVTDVNGDISLSYNYSSDEPITGRIRNASGSSKYKTTNFVGTITSNGFSTTQFMIGDE